MTNREIALAAVRQCTAQRYAENAQAHAQALHEAADRYLADLGAISSPDLQAIRTLRYDADRASIDARYANAKARAAIEAVDRAIRTFDARDAEGAKLYPDMSPAAIAKRAAAGILLAEDVMGYLTPKE